MENEKNDKFIKALKSNDSLLEFIKEQSMSGGLEKKAIDTVRGSHPSKEMLYDYVLNWGDKKIESLIMEHIAICPQCGQEVLNIMEIERELDEDLLKWADQIPLTQKIKKLISSVSLSVYSFPVDALATRSEGKIDVKKYSIGDSIVFCIPVVADGYLVVLQYDTNEEISLISPLNSEDDGFIHGGNEKRISGKVTGPIGKQYFKVFWSAKNVLETEFIDFKNKDSVEEALNSYFDALKELKDDDWIETVYEYEVVE
jgi:hypothetical protein